MMEQGTRSVGGAARILVVDDEPMIGSAIARTLTGHLVVRATRVAQALELLEAGERFDLIFSDLSMPEGDGATLYRSVATMSPEQAAQIVFISGGACTPAQDTFLREVANEKLPKPFEATELRALVARRLQQGR